MSEDATSAAKIGADVKEVISRYERLRAPYERTLGDLTMRFSFLHFLLERFSWEVWGLNRDMGAILTKDLTVRHLVEKLSESTKYVMTDTTERNELLRILKKVKQVASTRNEFLHSLWIIIEGEPVFCLSRKRGQLVGPDAPSPKKISELSNKIGAITVDFGEFCEQFRKKRAFGCGLSELLKRS